jgi:hypothetical protein
MAHKDETVRYGIGGYRTLHPLRSDASLNEARKDASKQLDVMTRFKRRFMKELKKYNTMYMTLEMRKQVFHDAEEALFKALNK